MLLFNYLKKSVNTNKNLQSTYSVNHTFDPTYHIPFEQGKINKRKLALDLQEYSAQTIQYGLDKLVFPHQKIAAEDAIRAIAYPQEEIETKSNTLRCKE